MAAKERVLAIITARGGSKGLPRKNVLPLAGKPLIAWTIEAALTARHVDRLILSSDDEEIIAVARAHGCDVPFRRPADLADDRTPTEPVILHALDTLEAAGDRFDWVMLLQPTTPFRTAADIDGCVDACLAAGKSSMVSMMPAKGTYWTFTLDGDGNLAAVVPGGIGRRRQDLPATYMLNGAIYLARVETFRAQGTFIGAETGAYVIPTERSVDIDTPLDMRIAEVVAESLAETTPEKATS